MKKEKYYLYLTDEERSEIIQSLIEKKNALLKAGRYTDAVDDVICKIIRAKRKMMTVK